MQDIFYAIIALQIAGLLITTLMTGAKAMEYQDYLKRL